MNEIIKEKYKKKLISVDDALKLVKSDTDVIVGLAAAEPKLFFKRTF